jgi:signal peptidase II
MLNKMPLPPYRRLLLSYLIVLMVVVADQASKAWILYDVMSPPQVLPFLPFIDLVLAWNPGIGFGLLKAHSMGGIIILISLALIISICLSIWVWRTQNKLLFISLSLIIGGAFGNIIDRLRFGAVLDFIYVQLYIFGYRFPAFNLADSAITLGAGLLFLENFYEKK